MTRSTNSWTADRASRIRDVCTARLRLGVDQEVLIEAVRRAEGRPGRRGLQGGAGRQASQDSRADRDGGPGDRAHHRPGGDADSLDQHARSHAGDVGAAEVGGAGAQRRRWSSG